MSLLGRPNMDEELEDVDEHPHDGEEEEEECDDVCDDDDSDDDDGWGELTVNNATLDTLREAIMSDSGGGAADGMLFVPEPVVSLLNDAKPSMPLLDKEQLPMGVTVWVVDEDDVKLLLKDAWEPAIRVVCNGREQGKVQRHNGDLTLVAFVNESIGMHFSFTLPRPCLSIVPVLPYESNKPATKQSALASSFGVGNLGPRTGRGTARTKEEVNILQQYYEVMIASLVKCKNAQEHWDMFVKGKVGESLKAISQMIEEAQEVQHTPEGSPLGGTMNHSSPDGTLSRASSVSSNTAKDGNNCASLTLKELYSIRSMIRIFANDSTGALTDAQQAIQLNPSWVKGYLRAARAHQACGKFTLAGHMINQTLLLLPHSDDVGRLSDLNNYLRRANSELEAVAPHVGIRLSCTYAKLLTPKRGFQPGEVIYEETDPVLSMPSMQNATPCCTVCLRTEGLTEMTIDSTPTHKGGGAASSLTRPFCSQACQQRATLFLPMELVSHELGLRSASSLIYSKAANSMNMLPLEQARLTMRLFFIVCTTHARLQAQREQQHVQQAVQDKKSADVVLKTYAGTNKEASVSIEEALQHLGIFPLVSTSIDNKTRDDLTTLCNVLCQAFEAEEKLLYSTSLFIGLYSYVAYHIVYAETPGNSGGGGLGAAEGDQALASSASGSAPNVKGYHLGRLSGGIETVSAGDKPNCEVLVHRPGTMTVVATEEILKDGKLLRPVLKTTQH